MDRDRRRDDRELPVPIEDRYLNGRGQSYRPGNVRERTPPSRMDSYRTRSPARRADFPPMSGGDSYRAARPRTRSPASFRRRTPSPPRYREREAPPRGGDSYRGRPRSPPSRREELPRDDLFRREPPAREERDFRDYRDDRDRGGYAAPAATGRSPLPRFRDRSAVPLKRVRDPSPISSRGRRTPPPAKRERLASPPRGRYDDYPPSRGVSPPRRRFSPERRNTPPRVAPARDYRQRSRSPMAMPRSDRVDPRSMDDWRRPRSPVRELRSDHLSRDDSGQRSGTTSRRSSPPMHPSRIALHQPAAIEERRPLSRASARDPYDTRDTYRAPPHDAAPRTLPPAEPAYYEDSRRDAIPPPREPRRMEDLPPQRAPPTGPSSQRGPAVSMAPPTGPAAAANIAPRAVAAPPSGPRGSAAPRGEFAPRGRGGFGGDFVPRGRGAFGVSMRGGRGGAPPGSGFGRGGSDAGFGRGGGDVGYGRTGGDGGGYSRSGGDVAAGFNRGGAESGYGRGGAEPGFGRGGGGGVGDTGPYIARSETFDHQQQQDAPSQQPRVPPSGPRGSFAATAPPGPSRQNSIVAPPAFPRAPVVDAPTGPKAGRRPPLEPAAMLNKPQVHPAIADLPKIVEGGIKAEPLTERSKLGKLEEEAERLRRQIEDRETRKRKNMREWDRMTRETEAAALRSELAEQSLKLHNGEAESQAAF
ncbi:uncharacterized protein RCC_05880 [Ramularia collo-cygni]|uniref:Uncharacterized protein n=1 Tax=Ramularia collo-cygni TaxID=112498 RepID=A0A2D3VH24_9PEZI|nr:uncharacterized protein RCC_05880 [Ramularia collo-cygni]CZT20023.1 uncharacterized protein RCC_05880 [Ramularia collo-cygni]